MSVGESPPGGGVKGGSVTGWRVAMLLIGAVVALQSLEVLFGQGIFFAHDLRHHHFPWRLWAARGWGSFEVPLWASQVGNGFPLMADGQTGVLYPPNIVLGAILPAHFALSFSLLIHQWWGGLGAWYLARRMGRSEIAALFAGVAFALSGFVVTHFTYAGMVQAASWLPWGVGLVLAISAGAGWRVAMLWGGVVAMALTAGHPQVAAISLLGCAVAGALNLRSPGAIVKAGVGAAIGLATALPQLLASLELSAHSAREGGVDAAFADMGSLPPQELLNVALPRFWGWERPVDILQTYVHKGSLYFGTGENHWESAFYVGVPLLILALWGMVKRGELGWKVLAVASALLMLGGMTPLYGLLRMVPGFSFFRFPVRFSLLLTLALIVLASGGLDDLLDRREDRREHLFRRGLMALVPLFVVGATAGWLFFRSQGERLQAILRGPEPPPGFAERVEGLVEGLTASLTPWGASVLWPALLAGLVVVLLRVKRRRITPAVAGRLLLALLVVDLTIFGSDYNPSSPPEEAFEKSRIAEIVTAEEGITRLASVDRVQPPELDRELLAASIGTVFGANDVIVLSPLLIPRNETLLAAAGLDVGMDHGPGKVDDLKEHLSIAERMGVEWVTSVHEIQHRDLEPMVEGEVNLYRNRSNAGRVWFSSCVVEVEGPDGALDALLGEARVERVVVEGSHGFEAREASPACREGEVEVERFEEHAVDISVDLPRAGVVVLADNWYPGWEATLDGEPVEVLRADLAFRGVSVPAGTHRIEYRYNPEWGWSLKLSGVGWLVLLGALVAPIGRRRR